MDGVYTLGSSGMAKNEKCRPMTVKWPPAADAALEALAAELALDRSATIRFVVMEKARAMGLLDRRAPAEQAAPAPKRTIIRRRAR